jgi:hypothetical protein
MVAPTLGVLKVIDLKHAVKGLAFTLTTDPSAGIEASFSL